MENIIKSSIPDMPYFPSVNFNYETGVCEISGESYMEDTYKFYTPLINWMRQYIAKDRPITFNFKLTYFNTSSSRIILDILGILKEYKLKGGLVEVNWFYRTSDPDMVEEIDDFQRESGVDIVSIELN
jgi:hypothetical protein